MFYGSYAGAHATRDAGGGGARRRVPGADQGGLGAPDAGVPPGVHQPDDPRRHRGADELAGRAAADGRRQPTPRCCPGAAQAGRHPAPAARARPAHAGAALPRRPDERASTRAATSPPTSAGARLVALESNNHIVLEDEPAWPVFAARGHRVPRARPHRRPRPAAADDARRAAVRARDGRAAGWRPRGRTTTGSPPRCALACAPSSGTCRTSTRSSASRAARPAPPPSRGCSRV